MASKLVVGRRHQRKSHSYVLAILFATWKLGGDVFTLLDYHIPREKSWSVCFSNIVPSTCDVLAPLIEPVLENFIKGENLSF